MLHRHLLLCCSDVDRRGEQDEKVLSLQKELQFIKDEAEEEKEILVEQVREEKPS